MCDGMELSIMDASNLDLEHARIVQVDLLNESFVVVCFSNGVSAKLDSAKLKWLTITSATEFVRPSDDTE